MPIVTPDPMGRGVSADHGSEKSPALVLCGAHTRQGGQCGQVAMQNGRCYLHGGLSTGPRTAEGRARFRAAVTTHGNRSAEARRFRALLRQLRAEARRTCEAV